MLAQLKINPVTKLMKIGTSDEERVEVQPIRINIVVRFLSLPEACLTDEIEDTICYQTDLMEIVNRVTLREFKTIERLGYVLHQELSEQKRAHHCSFNVTIHKVNPPVPGMTEGVEFSINDASH